MRLTCPSCAAAYEVDPGLVAPAGQHVQCSACHTRWFIRPPAAVAAAREAETLSEDDIIARLEARPRGPRPVPRSVDPDEASAGRPGRQPGEPAVRVVPSVSAKAGGDFVWEEPDGSADPAPERPRLRVVPTAPPPEAEGEAEPATAPEHVTELEGSAALEPAPSEAPAPTGRPRLELGTGAEAAPAPSPAPAPRRRFGRGVMVGLVLVGLAAAVYRFEDDIAAAAPPAAPYLERYASGVDEARLWLEARLGPVTARLRERVAGIAGAP